MGSLSSDALNRLARRARAKPASSTATDNGAMLAAVLDDLRALGIETGKEKPYHGGGRLWELSECPYSNDHDDGAYLVVYADGVPYVRCQHERCQGRTIQDASSTFLRAVEVIHKHRAGGKRSSRASDPEAGDRPLGVAIVQSLAEIEAKPIDWLWQGWLPAGMFTLFGGYAGDGKSTICTYLAAKFSIGGQLPDGTIAPVLNSLFLSAEEDPQYALRPRLDLHQADVRRVFTMRGTTGQDGKLRWANLATDMPQLRAVIETYKIGIVFFDPISSYLPGTDRNAEGDMRDALSGLQTLMEDTGVAIVGVSHVGKGDGRGRRIEQRLLSSTAFVAIARTVWMLNDLPDDHQMELTPGNQTGRRKVFGVAKANYAIKPESLMFTRPLDGALQFLGPSPVSIAASFDVESTREGKAIAVDEWLTECLGKGAKSIAELLQDCGDRYSVKTIRAGLHRINAVTSQLPGKAHGGWFWRLDDMPETVDPVTSPIPLYTRTGKVRKVTLHPHFPMMGK